VCIQENPSNTCLPWRMLCKAQGKCQPSTEWGGPLKAFFHISEHGDATLLSNSPQPFITQQRSFYGRIQTSKQYMECVSVRVLFFLCLRVCNNFMTICHILYINLVNLINLMFLFIQSIIYKKNTQLVIIMTHYQKNPFGHGKEWNLMICSNMGETGGHYIKWNKPSTEK
jgi:hypothetical protein